MSLRAERSNLVYNNRLYLLDCFVVALLAMTRFMTFYESVIFRKFSSSKPNMSARLRLTA